MYCPSCRAPNTDTAGLCVACGQPLHLLVRGTLLAKRYEIIEPLGSGGMGVVYKAHDQKLDEMVALKVLRADIAPQSARRFTSEIKLARRVRHRNVCAIHEYHEEGSLRFIAMELIEGVDLRRILKERGALPLREAYDVAVQVAVGLEAIHEVGIVHRDLKTSNLMRDARGVVRLMDFGIAKELGDQEATGLTAAGQIVGTPEYMSPEQAQGRKIDNRSDLYALGIVIFELFTGAVPFRGPTPVSTLFKHVREPPPLDGPRGAGIPPELLPILRKALAKDPDERFATAREMADTLGGARDHSASRSLTGRGGEVGPLRATATWPATARTAPPTAPVRDRETAAPTAWPIDTTAEPTVTRARKLPSAERQRRSWLLALAFATVALMLGGLLGYAYLRLSLARASLPSRPALPTPTPAAVEAAPPSVAGSPPPGAHGGLDARESGSALPPQAKPSARVATRMGAGPAAVVFVPGATTFTAPTSVVPRGFGDPPPGVEIRPAQAPAPRAQLVIEATPSVIRPGDRYVVRYFLFNVSAAPLTIGAVALRHTPSDGMPSAGAVEPLSRSARPQSRTLLCETSGTWARVDPRAGRRR